MKANGSDPRESISDSSSGSSEDESAPRKPKSRRDKAHLAFQRSPNARLKSLFPVGSKQPIDPPLPSMFPSVGSDTPTSFDTKVPLQAPEISAPKPFRNDFSVSEAKDALDEDLIAFDDGQKLVGSEAVESVSGDTEEKETIDRWRGRLWPSKAVISYVRVLTRCQPPVTFVGEKIHLGKSFFRYNHGRFTLHGISESQFRREGNNIWPHWKSSDLSTLGTYFDSVQGHSSAFFLLIAEESRVALSSQYDEMEFSDNSDDPRDSTSADVKYEHAGSSGRSNYNESSSKANGWLDGEIAIIAEETPLGHLPESCRDSRLGSVWAISVLMNSSNIVVSDELPSLDHTSEKVGQFDKGSGYGSDNIVLSGGDVVVIHSAQWGRPILGIIQPWDPDYDMKVGTKLTRMAPSSSSSNKYGKDSMMVNIMICVDGGDPVDAAVEDDDSSPNEKYNPFRSGWASSGSVFPGVRISLAVLGNVMTYIRECQALLSLRMLNARLRSAILRPPNFLLDTAITTTAAPTVHTHGSGSGGAKSSSTPPSCIPVPMWRSLLHTFNPSQLHALQSIIARNPTNAHQLSSPIHLLQGPPGTGKTKTILGIASIFFAGGLPPVGRAQKGQRVVAGASIMSAARRPSTSASTSSSSSSTTATNATGSLTVSTERDPRRPRLLLCAPSNTAVDELVYRIVTQGLFDERGVQRSDNLNVVRIGAPNKDEYIRKHHNNRAGGRGGGYHRGGGKGGKGGGGRGGGGGGGHGSGHGGPAAVSSELSPQELSMIRVVEGVCLDNLVEEKRQQLASLPPPTAAAQPSSSFMKTGHVLTMSTQQLRSNGQGGPSQPSLPSGWRISELRRQVLEQADIVCCTLSGAGSQPILEILLRIPHFQFDAVIIDEAAQTVEPSSLIPFKFNPQVVVMVGDPCQLPPTIFSSSAKRANYGQSLFERLQLTNQIPLSILATQYRMHPAIAAYPAQRFYNGHLLHGHVGGHHHQQQHQHRSSDGQPALTASSLTKPYHHHVSGRFRPLVFHDIAFGREEYDHHQSVMNMAEANYVLSLYGKFLTLLAEMPNNNSNNNNSNSNSNSGNNSEAPISIGIIVPYRGQRRLLMRLFKERFGRDYNTHRQVDIEISTVDGFQGREKDIIIFSCVRAPNARQHNRSCEGSIGFLRDWRRLNVAITRAKHALWIVGNGEWLSEKDPEWNGLISFVKQRALEDGEAGATQYLRLNNNYFAKAFTMTLAEMLRAHPVRLTRVNMRPTSVGGGGGAPTPTVPMTPSRPADEAASAGGAGPPLARPAGVSSSSMMPSQPPPPPPPPPLPPLPPRHHETVATTAPTTASAPAPVVAEKPPLHTASSTSSTIDQSTVEESRRAMSVSETPSDMSLPRKRAYSGSHIRFESPPKSSSPPSLLATKPSNLMEPVISTSMAVNRAHSPIKSPDLPSPKRAKVEEERHPALSGPFSLSHQDKMEATSLTHHHLEPSATKGIAVREQQLSFNVSSPIRGTTATPLSRELSSPNTFTRIRPELVHAIATPSERLRTFYHHLPQIDDLMDLAHDDTPQHDPTAGPFSAPLLAEEQKVLQEPLFANLPLPLPVKRERALSSISLSSTSTAMST